MRREPAEGAMVTPLNRKRGWMRALGFISREVGLHQFIGGEERLQTALREAFGPTDEGLLRAARVVAVDSVHCVRRALGEDEGALAPKTIAKILVQLHKLHISAQAGKLSNKAALVRPLIDSVLAVYIATTLRDAPRGPERIAALQLAIKRLPAHTHAELPPRFKTLSKKASSLTFRDNLEPLLSELDELVETHAHMRVKREPDGIVKRAGALGKIAALLDRLKLDHVWMERADQLDRDFNRGKIVQLDSLAQKGRQLIESGEWQFVGAQGSAQPVRRKAEETAVKLEQETPQSNHQTPLTNGSTATQSPGTNEKLRTTPAKPPTPRDALNTPKSTTTTPNTMRTSRKKMAGQSLEIANNPRTAANSSGSAKSARTPRKVGNAPNSAAAAAAPNSGTPACRKKVKDAVLETTSKPRTTPSASASASGKSTQPRNSNSPKPPSRPSTDRKAGNVHGGQEATSVPRRRRRSVMASEVQPAAPALAPAIAPPPQYRSAASERRRSYSLMHVMDLSVDSTTAPGAGRSGNTHPPARARARDLAKSSEKQPARRRQEESYTDARTNSPERNKSRALRSSTGKRPRSRAARSDSNADADVEVIDVDVGSSDEALPRRRKRSRSLPREQTQTQTHTRAQSETPVRKKMRYSLNDNDRRNLSNVQQRLVEAYAQEPTQDVSVADLL